MELSSKYGKWALVTGATSGLGLAFAEYLAAQHLNLILIARRESLLLEIANKLKAQFFIEVRVIALDLTDTDLLEKLLPQIQELEIGLLVNNAGIGRFGELDNVPLEDHLNVIELNCNATMYLTHYLLSGMKDRNKGAVIFAGSIVGHGGTPLYSTYAASKAFNISFAKSIWLESKQHNIDILVVSPGTMSTEFHKNAGIRRSGLSMPPEKVVRKSMSALGKHIEYVPGVVNKVIVLANDLINFSWFYLLKNKFIKKNLLQKNGEPSE